MSQISWTRTFGGPFSNDEAYTSIQTIDGNYITVGDSGNGEASILIKFSTQGDIIWKKKFLNNERIGYGVVQDANGNLFFNTWRGILKTDMNGNILWKRLFTDTTIGFLYLKFTMDFRNLICYGYNFLGKVDSNGSLIWYKYLQDSVYTSYHVKDVAEISGNFYFAGVRESPGVYKGFIKKYDNSGNLLWTKYYNPGVLIYSIAENSENSFVIAGMKNYYLYVSKLDINGNLVWERNYISDSITIGNSICKAGNNRFVIASNSNYVHGKCLVIDSTGNILVNKNHSYGVRDWVNYSNVIASNDSGFVFTGYIEFNESGPVDWLVVKTDKYGNTTPIGINPIGSSIPEQFKLYQSYPNPFNPSTKIKFEISSTGGSHTLDILFKVYDITGREVYSLSETRSPGTYEISFDAANYSTGMYFYTMQSGEYKETRKMVLIK